MGRVWPSVLHVNEVRIIASNIMLPMDWQNQVKEVDVDTLNTESATSGEIDTSAETSPYTVLTPSSGKKISTRSVYMVTDSTSGEVTMKYQNSGKIIAKIYCSRYYQTSIPRANVLGDTDDPIVIEWSGLSTGAKISYTLGYKETT